MLTTNLPRTFTVSLSGRSANYKGRITSRRTTVGRLARRVEDDYDWPAGSRTGVSIGRRFRRFRRTLSGCVSGQGNLRWFKATWQPWAPIQASSPAT